MVGYRQDQGIRVQHDGIKVVIHDLSLDNCQVQLVSFQLIIKIIYGVRNNRYAAACVQAAVTCQDLHHDIALRGVGDSDGQPGDVTLLIAQTLLQILVERLNSFGVLYRNFPFLRQFQGAFPPNEERCAQILFQLADMLADRRLRQGKQLGRLCKTACLIDLNQGFQFGIHHEHHTPIIKIYRYNRYHNLLLYI